MLGLVNDRNVGIYHEILNGMACCYTYMFLCQGEFRLADGSAYRQRTISVEGRTFPEADAYDAALTYLAEAARGIANLGSGPDKLSGLPDYDTTFLFTAEVMRRWSEDPDEEFWLQGLLKALYAKSALDNTDPAESVMVLGPLNVAISGLVAASPFDEQTTRQKISKLWNASQPMPSISRSKPASQPTTQGSSSAGGCYIATAVYGSYDCPEVWTLRRFRDYGLAKSAPGRLFIRAYYAVSPHLVKRFGEAEWFKKATMPLLAALVSKCREKGLSDKPYED